jgi:NDP-sugar pyrophosphorylase family protein
VEIGALIMAAGQSMRMRAGGSGQHKGLRTVLGVPLIERNLRTLLWFGFARVFVAVNAAEAAMRAWVDGPGRANAEAHGATLEALIETEPRGTIGAVSSLPRELEHALIVNVDNLTRLDLSRLMSFHRERAAAATIATHDHPFPIPFGTVELSGARVLAYREKPQLSVPISSGVYALSRRAIDRVPQGARFDAPALIGALLGAGEAVLAFAHQEPWIDVNDEAALAQAQRLFEQHGRDWPGAAAAPPGQNEHVER